MRFGHHLVKLSVPALIVLAVSSCSSSGGSPVSSSVSSPVSSASYTRFAVSPPVSPISAALAEVSVRVRDGGIAGMVIPGLAAAVHRPDRPLLKAAYGFADREALLPASAGDLFPIGSLTATFTAALIMQLDQEKRLSIDDPVSPAYVPLPDGEKITIRMLLGHTSGIQSFTDAKLAPQFKALLKKNDNPQPREMMDLVIGSNVPDFAPGAKYRYSDSNCLLLGMIAEKVTGRSWHEEVRSRFLTPLNLRNTYVYGKESGPDAVAGYTICADENCSRYAVTRVGAGPDWKASWAAGAIVSTAEDVATWIHALVVGDLLDAAHRTAMQTATPQSKTWAAALLPQYGVVTGVGLGLFQYAYPDVGEGWGQEGRTGGHSNMGIYFPQAGLGVSLLTNLAQTDMTTALGRVATAADALTASDSGATTHASTATPWTFGARGDGITDDTAAVSAAINAAGTTLIDGGTFLVNSQITIGSANKKIVFGPTGSIVRGTGVGVDFVLYATGKNGLVLENPKMTVAAMTTQMGYGGFINLFRCNNLKILNPDLNGANGSGRETLLRGIATPDCNDVLILNPKIQNIIGSGCGADNASGLPGYGERFIVVGGLIKNVIDTGIGAWTGAKTVRIMGTRVIRNNYDSAPNYSGVGVDVAGAEDVDIQGDFDGNTIAVRVLTNLGYTNRNIRIHHSSAKNQRSTPTEPGTFVKVSMYGTMNDDMDVSITDNDVQVNGSGAVSVVGINLEDIHTGTGILRQLVDRNRFTVNSSLPAFGIYLFSGPTTNGRSVLLPGKNTFTLSGSGVAVQGSFPWASSVLESGAPIASIGPATLSATATLGYAHLDVGTYFVTYSFSAADRAGGSGHYLRIDDTAGANAWYAGINDTLANTYVNGPSAGAAAPYFTVTTAGVHRISVQLGTGAPAYKLNFFNIQKVF